MKLYKRNIFNQIEPYIGDETIIVLHGARQVGKTHILFYIRDRLVEKGQKIYYYDLEYPDILADFNKGVDVFLAILKGKGYREGETIYVLIDEIQYLDNPSSFLKILADHYKNIHLIVSGSSTFDIKSKFTDSLVGRTTSFEVYPLSFDEFLMFKEAPYVLPYATSSSTIEHLKAFYKEFVLYGGYPKVVLEPVEEKKKSYLLQVIDTYIRKDVRDLAQVEDIRKFNNMLFVLASQSGQLLNMRALSRETNISFPTLQKYLAVLEETFVLKLVSPYSKSPSVEISKQPKIFFYDSGLQSLLWFKTFQTTILGSVFEINIFGELVKKFDRSVVHYWRTKTRQEIDFVIETAKGVMPMEIKTNFQRFNPKAINSFKNKYKVGKWMVIGLEGEKESENYIYPWEV
ncbi:ATP-binding protein [Patescibacteria group bacterium]|nr:ATP-binding protein [Patescibacteria group bacterium]MBU4017313.1 ATP-binding protein [Patescibacteria group bacterium]MBU4099269.1 ATP-binding protein [Patescibacteria group bacterium]